MKAGGERLESSGAPSPQIVGTSYMGGSALCPRIAHHRNEIPLEAAIGR
jgi:hypothetical protein